MQESVTLDGNQAVAHVAYLASEVIAIYPITPASPMGEWADQWAAEGRPNLWGQVPLVVEMQSEGGAAGAVHGALQGGTLATSFTASQGLLLMLPNLYKIAGELSPLVVHVAARALATHALSIFGDHSDVMACRATGLALLASGSVQEAADLAAVAHAATLEGRVPFLHFFDGFRTSHEVNRVQLPGREVLSALGREAAREAHRLRALDPEHPVLRGTAQNPDVFFQGREAASPFHQRLPGVVERVMARLRELTWRAYRLFDYTCHPRAERVVVAMGSAAGTLAEVVEHLNARGARVGLVTVRLYRPFSPGHLLAALPGSVRALAVLDRTKEPGADGEPLFKDVLAALARAHARGRLAAMPRVVGGRYGLGSKEFTPGMARAVFDELDRVEPRDGFTVGIHDDVGCTSLPFDPDFRPEAGEGNTRCVFYGLGSDGTVGANKNAIKIIAAETGLHAQGYFQYDSKKSGAVTVSHLRFGPRPIRSAYLIGPGEARFVACHQPALLGRYDILEPAAPGATFLLNSPLPPERVWAALPWAVRRQAAAKGLDLWVVDAYAIADAAGTGRRINTIMQVCFFALAGVMDPDRARQRVKEAVAATYGAKGEAVVAANLAAVDAALQGLRRVVVPADPGPGEADAPRVPGDAPEFVRTVTAPLLAGRGDGLPVSALPVDGTWPTGTAAYEKRAIARELPRWDPALCTHCGKCVLVCPHAALRSKVFPEAAAAGAPAGFRHAPVKGRDFAPGLHIAYQVAPDDCTGCAQCAVVCPISDRQDPAHKALDMVPAEGERAPQRAAWDFFLGLPDAAAAEVKTTTVKGAMLLTPRFEFSGACTGCGETPYIRLASQLFGDRMVVANATGCSSIYGGNLPTCPWTVDRQGRGPAWSNSLFEDNAEFGLGMRLAIDHRAGAARDLLRRLAPQVGEDLAAGLLEADQGDAAGIAAQRERVALLRRRLAGLEGPEAARLLAEADLLVRRSVWLVGGDGWAYDIGYGGLDHVLASGRDVNLLVLDSEVYSNTGGQTSKATPLGAVARFSAGGKPTPKKDLALMAMAYGNVYVAQIAYGAKDVQTLRAFQEAESFPGPALVIAYSPCNAHGIDLADNLRHQELAVASGHWPLLRYDPRRAAAGESPLRLDSREPSLPYREFALSENRFASLAAAQPERAERLLDAAEHWVRRRYQLYQQMATMTVGSG